MRILGHRHWIFPQERKHSLGGYEFGLELESVLGKFDKNELQRHFINGISISSTFIVFISYSSSHLRIMFSVISDLTDMPPGTDCPYRIRSLAFYEMIRPYRVMIRI